MKFRCEYKIPTLAYCHIDGTLTSYLSVSLCAYETPLTLRSSSEKLVKTPKRDLISVEAVLSVSLLKLSAIRCLALSDLKAQLKTFLFQQAFPQVQVDHGVCSAFSFLDGKFCAR